MGNSHLVLYSSQAGTSGVMQNSKKLSHLHIPRASSVVIRISPSAQIIMYNEEIFISFFQFPLWLIVSSNLFYLLPTPQCGHPLSFLSYLLLQILQILVLSISFFLMYGMTSLIITAAMIGITMRYQTISNWNYESNR